MESWQVMANVAFLSVEGVLLLSPPLGYLLARRLRGTPSRARAVLLGMATWCPLLVVAADAAGWSFRGVGADIVACGVAYLGYCVLAFGLLAIRWRLVRFVAVSLAALPMLAVWRRDGQHQRHATQFLPQPPAAPFSGARILFHVLQ